MEREVAVGTKNTTAPRFPREEAELGMGSASAQLRDRAPLAVPTGGQPQGRGRVCVISPGLPSTVGLPYSVLSVARPKLGSGVNFTRIPPPKEVSRQVQRPASLCPNFLCRESRSPTKAEPGSLGCPMEIPDKCQICSSRPGPSAGPAGPKVWGGVLLSGILKGTLPQEGQHPCPSPHLLPQLLRLTRKSDPHKSACPQRLGTPCPTPPLPEHSRHCTGRGHRLAPVRVPTPTLCTVAAGAWVSARVRGCVPGPVTPPAHIPQTARWPPTA